MLPTTKSSRTELGILSRIQLFATPWTLAHQAPLSVGFPRQEYWSGLPFPPPGDLPNSGTEPTSLEFPALAGGFLTTTPPGKAKIELYDQQITGWKPNPSDNSAPWRLFPSPTGQAICCLSGSKIHLEHCSLPLYFYSRIQSLLLLLFKIKVLGPP